jgi:hypothetical protein
MCVARQDFQPVQQTALNYLSVDAVDKSGALPELLGVQFQFGLVLVFGPLVQALHLLGFVLLVRGHRVDHRVAS